MRSFFWRSPSEKFLRQLRAAGLDAHRNRRSTLTRQANVNTTFKVHGTHKKGA
jgi:hypothetical protein